MQKNLSQLQQKEKEGQLILSKIQPSDQLVLLDDKGKHFTSIEFSHYLQKKNEFRFKTIGICCRRALWFF